MNKNMQQLVNYLQRVNLKIADQNDELVLLRFGSEHGDQKMFLLIEEGRLLQSVVYPAIRIAEGSRSDVAIAVARANYGLKIGNFELDMNDGELRYQAALPFEGELPGDHVLERIVYVGLSMMNRYMPAFLSVIYGNEPAKDAIALVEKV